MLYNEPPPEGRDRLKGGFRSEIATLRRHSGATDGKSLIEGLTWWVGAGDGGGGGLQAAEAERTE